MGGVMQLYISTRDTQRTSEDQLQLLSDARFAIETIAYDLRHAGIWGGTNETKLIACHKDTELPCTNAGMGYTMSLAAGDCENNHYIDFMQPVVAFDNGNPYAATCAAQSYKADTDVLSLRYADSSWVADASLAAGVPFVRSNIGGGQLFIGPTIPDTDLSKWDDAAFSKNHPLISRVYYVSDYTEVAGDGLPSLHRVDLGSGPEMYDRMLLPGVEDFQLEFGIDTNKDFQVNSYVKASNVADWTNGSVVAVRIWVLMRSERKDRNDISSAQTFTMAGNTFTTPNDGYRRFLMSDVVRLRNMMRLDLSTAGGG